MCQVVEEKKKEEEKTQWMACCESATRYPSPNWEILIRRPFLLPVCRTAREASHTDVIIVADIYIVGKLAAAY